MVSFFCEVKLRWGGILEIRPSRDGSDQALDTVHFKHSLKFIVWDRWLFLNNLILNCIKFSSSYLVSLSLKELSLVIVLKTNENQFSNNKNNNIKWLNSAIGPKESDKIN